jgi:hypothetical protein
VESHFLDEIGNSGNKTVSELTKYINGEKALMGTEKYARSISFFSFVHFLEKSGLKGQELYKAAADATDIAMTNYGQHERALIYNHMGVVGQLASPLTTFKHNFFSQLYLYGKDALTHPTEINYAKPLLGLLAAQYIVGGYMGMPGRTTADWVIDFARAHNLLDPRTKNVTQTLAQYSQEAKGKNFIRYGLFGGMTGMDVSPTFAAADLVPLPKEQAGSAMDVVGKLLPIPAKIAEITGNVANVGGKELGRLVGGQGSTSTDRASLIKSATPPAFQFGAEAAIQEPNGQIPNPNRHMEGTVRRAPFSPTDADWAARMLGTRTIKESEQSTAAWQAHLQEQAINSRKTSLVGDIIDMRKDHKDTSKQVQEYIKLGGTTQSLVQDIQKNQIARGQTSLEQQKGIPKNLQGVKKYQRAGEYK